MTWPIAGKRFSNVVDATNLVDNLLGFIETNQADVLLWANGSPLPNFAGLYSNATGRLKTLFPQFIVVAQSIETDLTGDVLLTAWEPTFEIAITGPDPDLLVMNTKVYAMAVESILSNIESEDLTGDPNVTASLMELQTRFDVVRGATPVFMQIFQTKAGYRILTPAF